MKLSVAWLRELVDLPEDVEEIAQRLTLLGLEVEELQEFRLSWPGVVVGEVLEAGPHPDADKLRLCRVAVGGEELPIVCGAPNVRQGLRVAVATVGAVLPGDFRIRKSRIRGEVSMGMICSEKELGLGQGHEGILELGEDATVGRPLDELFGHHDHRIEIEVTPNRPDWLSHIGVARELAAWYRVPLRLPQVGGLPTAGEEDGGWRVAIDDPAGCPHFSAQLLDGAKVGPSPLWLRQRLLSIGQRPINAVVDASNLVLHETGHPNHVFDRAKLRGQEIRVRGARDGEAFTTLDGSERELSAGQLLVCDAEGPVALAGVMGGANSEVDGSSEALLVEVAIFDPRRTRSTRRALNMSTDASYRFERGVDPAGVHRVQARLAQLLGEVAGASGSGRLFEARGDAPPAAAPFFVRASQARRLLGVGFEPAGMAGILERLEIGAEATTEAGEAGVRVQAPSFRHDLLEEVDALEELARHHGFDRLETAARAPMLRPAGRAPLEATRRRLRESFAALRFHEVVHTHFMPEGDPDRLQLPDDDPRRSVLRVLNPIAQGEAALRTTAVPGMLRIADLNRRRGATGPVRLFQLARLFHPRVAGELPDEPEQLVVLWEGEREPDHYEADGAPVGYPDALGDLAAGLGRLGLEPLARPATAEPWQRRGSTVELRAGETPLGQLGEVSGEVLEAFDLPGPCFVAELDLSALDAARPVAPAFRPFSAYPPVRRDLSLVVPAGIGYAEVEAAAREQFGALLEELGAFDLYEGEGLPEGSRALGLRLSLRSADGTLKEKKVEAQLQRLLSTLEERHGVQLRA